MLCIFSVQAYTQRMLRKEKDKICMLSPEIKVGQHRFIYYRVIVVLTYLLMYSVFWSISESDESLSSEEQEEFCHSRELLGQCGFCTLSVLSSFASKSQVHCQSTGPSWDERRAAELSTFSSEVPNSTVFKLMVKQALFLCLEE